MPKEKVEEIREKMVKKLIEVNRNAAPSRYSYLKPRLFPKNLKKTVILRHGGGSLAWFRMAAFHAITKKAVDPGFESRPPHLWILLAWLDR